MKRPILPKEVEKILNTLTKAGFEAYIVGGCVRDCMLERVPQDWDITTSAEPEQVKALFSHTFDTGIQHGTVTVVENRNNYEITTYRVEGEYEDCRHPKEVYFTKNLKEDLLRRDFTMNAIAYHPKEGFQDYFGGMEDIDAQLIRGVGVAAQRFQEDALRMLRGVRFSAQLGFAMEPQTYQALQENRQLIQKISVERIHEELDKLLLGNHLENMPLLWESGLLGEISPFLQGKMKAHGNLIVVQLQQAPLDKEVRWALFLQDMTEKEAKAFLKSLKFDTQTLRGVTQLLAWYAEPLEDSPYALRKKMSKVGKEKMLQLLQLKSIRNAQPNLAHIQTTVQEILERQDCFTLKELQFTGGDLLKMGIPKGQQVGQILAYLLDVVHQNPAHNDPNFLKHCVQEYQKNQ